MNTIKKDLAGTLRWASKNGVMMNQADKLDTPHIPKILVVCNRQQTGSLWGYAIRQKGFLVGIEVSPLNALDRYEAENPDLIIIDVDLSQREIAELFKSFRSASTAPILLLLPAHNETQIIEAYEAGVDDVIVKPVSPEVFASKITAWARRSKVMPMERLSQLTAGNHRLDPNRRCLINPQGIEFRLTNLEYRLLHLLMSRPAQIFSAEEIIESIWGGFGQGDQVLLKNVVYRLRKKIEADPSRPLLLLTWQGGYLFQG
jgi:DNA-binding response OmpR family regulator